MIRNRFFLLLAAITMVACQASTNDSAPSEQAAASARPIGRGTPAVPSPEPLVIPRGTALAMTLQTTASSATSHEGDAVVAKLAESVRLGDRVVVPAGSEVRGRVIAAVPSGRVKGRARLALDFESIVVKGREVAIDTAPIDITARQQKKRDAAIIGGGTGAGAIVGGFVDGKKGAAIGALIGAGAGGGAVLATKGKEIHLPSGTALKIRLKEPARIA